MGHSCRKILWGTLVGHSCRTLLWGTRHSPNANPNGTAQRFLKNSHVKVCKSQAETPIGAHTSRSPAKQFRDSGPSKQHPLTRQAQCHSDIHLYHNSQFSRFPAPATNLSASRRPTCTKRCACHELSPPSHLATSRFPAPATKIALPHLKARKKHCACHET